MDIIRYGAVLIDEEFIDVNYHKIRTRIIRYDGVLWFLTQRDGEVYNLQSLGILPKGKPIY